MGQQIITISKNPCFVLTWVQQVGILVSQSLVGQEVVSISVEGKERHHVVAVVVANGSIGLWVASSGRLVGPEPAFVDTAKKKKRKILNMNAKYCLYDYMHFLLPVSHPKKSFSIALKRFQ